jgi:bifunctional non-homologous end joining protein LigD
LRREHRAGIVFKRLDAPYVAGRPNGGGTQLQYAFIPTVTAVVCEISEPRSVEVCLYQGRNLRSCGKVTIPPEQPLPVLGAVVAIRYCYASRESLALSQPVYLGVQHQVLPAECTVRQLKFKPATVIPSL